ncbi:hypothetical protein [Ekhidna sp.]|uniref:hypothetical protein n=1 Tax=Ekhidna sp. TaxID=2608089 RepID=UPI003BABF0E1
MAPESEYGPLHFSTPSIQEVAVTKQELGEHLTKYFESFGEFEYRQLFANDKKHLVLVVGKLIGSELTQYMMIGLAKFGENYRYISFSLLEELPPNMKHLDKDG